MKHEQKNGFSLTEVLIAVAILATGLLFVAGTFPVGIYFTAVAAEKTTAAVVADEAFAKVKLYGVDVNPSTTVLSNTEQKSFEVDVWGVGVIDAEEFKYPSTNNLSAGQTKQYSWHALCRKASADPTDRLVQVTVFVSRKTGASNYPDGVGGTVNWPMPVEIGVADPSPSPYIIEIADADKIYVNDDYKIVDGETGQIYRVIERLDPPNDIYVRLTELWEDMTSPYSFWVIPPPVSGGRWPCVGIYQRVIRF